MPCEKFKTTLGGVEYNYTQLPASKSLRLKLRITKVFSDVLPLLLGGLGKTDSEQVQLFATAINQMMSRNTTDEVADLILDSVRTVQIDDEQIDVDKQFSGNLVGLYTLIFWVLKKEYKDFLDVMTGLFDKDSVKKKTKAGPRNISQI